MPDKKSHESTIESTAKSRPHTRKGSSAHLIPQAIHASFIKLNPRTLMHNPVMFVVEIGSVISTYYAIASSILPVANAVFYGR